MKLRTLAVPYVGWMALFVVTPVLIVLVYAVTSSGGAFSLESFAKMGDYVSVFIRSFVLAVLSTVICLLIGYPVAYILAKERPRVQRILLMLVMLPMWMNFLLRTYAWMSILENTGLLNRLLTAVGLPAVSVITPPRPS
jgi:spermidine/putrescine transport system permease protein